MLGIDVRRTVSVDPLAGVTGREPTLDVTVDVRVAGVLEVVVSTSPAGDVTPRLAPDTATPASASGDERSVTWTRSVAEDTTETFRVEFDPGRDEPGVVPAVHVTLHPAEDRGLHHLDGTIDLGSTVMSRSVVMAQRVPTEGATPATAAGTPSGVATLDGHALVGGAAARIMATGDYRPGIDAEGWSNGEFDLEDLIWDRPLAWGSITSVYVDTGESLWWDMDITPYNTVRWSVGAVENPEADGMEDGEGQVIPLVFAAGATTTFRDGEPRGNDGRISLTGGGVRAIAGGQAELAPDDGLPILPILHGGDGVYDTSLAAYVLSVDAVGGDLVNDGETAPAPATVTMQAPPGWCITTVFEGRFGRGIDAFDVEGAFTDVGGYELTVSLAEGQSWLETELVEGLADWRHMINVDVIMSRVDEPLVTSPLVASHTASVAPGGRQLLTVHTAGGERRQHHLGPGETTVVVHPGRGSAHR